MQGVTLTTEELRKLLSSGCSDAIALYLYREAKMPLEEAQMTLGFTNERMVFAADSLKQLGLWKNDSVRTPLVPEKPTYTDIDVAQAMNGNQATFRNLVAEAQRQLGRTLSGEELKTMLSFIDYLRLPVEVLGILLHYCVQRNRRKGQRAPTMHVIEKEAYHWADEGIDSLEEASRYVQEQLEVATRVQHLRCKLQIDNRRLTTSEEQYLTTWIKMGFPDESIDLAYEKTCTNTGALKWPYMDGILRKWHEMKLHTPQEIIHGDTGPIKTSAKKQDVFQRHSDELSPLARRAVEQALAEGKD